MKYDQEYFDEGLYRVGSRCDKWDKMRAEKGADVLPLWVADMDFPSPPAVQLALLKRAAHPTYGYTGRHEDDFTAPIDFWRRHHNLSLVKDELVLLPCVITGMKMSIRVSTRPGEGVIIMPPVYGPFAQSVKATGRTLVNCPLILQGDGSCSMDLHAVETELKKGARALMLCSPHNPEGRLWSKEELTALAELMDRYDATLISDEIHADFIIDDEPFVPMLSLRTKKTVSLCSASKTFNLAGLQQALCLCKDEALRESIRTELDACGVRSGNLFAMDATRAAYEEGDEWLAGLVEYLRGSRDLLASLLKEQLPKAVMSPMQATYLAWVDLRAYGVEEEELVKRCITQKVFFTAGSAFGDEGKGWMRFNIGCPRRFIAEGVRRLKKALEG